MNRNALILVLALALATFVVLAFRSWEPPEVEVGLSTEPSVTRGEVDGLASRGVSSGRSAAAPEGRPGNGPAHLGSSVTALVRDRLSLAPLEGARVVLSEASGEFVSQSETDSDGVAWLAIEGGGSRTLHLGVQASDYVAQRRILPASDSEFHEELRFDLSRAHALRGRVTNGANGQPIQGATVVFLPTHMQFSKPVLLLAMEGVSECLIVRADENGSFEASGVAAGRSYRVLAGGAGSVTREPTFVFVPAGAEDRAAEPLELLAYPAYGLSLSLQDESGQPISLPTTAGVGLMMFTPEGWADRLDSIPFWTLGLAVDDLLAGVESSEVGTVSWAYATEREASSIEGVSVRWDHPGCAYEALVSVPRVRDFVPEDRAGFGCIGTDRGTVRLEFEGGSLLAGLAYRSPVYYLSLQEVGNPMGTVHRFQMLPKGATFEAHGVPAGRFEYSIKPLTYWWKFPRIAGGVIEVEPGVDSIVAVRSQDVCAAQLRVLDGSVGYEGALRVQVRLSELDDAEPSATPARFGTVNVDFANAPYVIPLVGPGRYELSLVGGEFGRDVITTQHVRVDPGTTEVVLQRSPD